jgi:hypothetical protein
MKITVECNVGQAITVSIDDETLVNHIGFAEEKPIEQETCKWKRSDSKDWATCPHTGMQMDVGWFIFCPICGKKIEVVK